MSKLLKDFTISDYKKIRHLADQDGEFDVTIRDVLNAAKACKVFTRKEFAQQLSAIKKSKSGKGIGERNCVSILYILGYDLSKLKKLAEKKDETELTAKFHKKIGIASLDQCIPKLRINLSHIPPEQFKTLSEKKAKINSWAQFLNSEPTFVRKCLKEKENEKEFVAKIPTKDTVTIEDIHEEDLPDAISAISLSATNADAFEYFKRLPKTNEAEYTVLTIRRIILAADGCKSVRDFVEHLNGMGHRQATSLLFNLGFPLSDLQGLSTKTDDEIKLKLRIESLDQPLRLYRVDIAKLSAEKLTSFLCDNQVSTVAAFLNCHPSRLAPYSPWAKAKETDATDASQEVSSERACPTAPVPILPPISSFSGGLFGDRINRFDHGNQTSSTTNANQYRSLVTSLDPENSDYLITRFNSFDRGATMSGANFSGALFTLPPNIPSVNIYPNPHQSILNYIGQEEDFRISRLVSMENINLHNMSQPAAKK